MKKFIKAVSHFKAIKPIGEFRLCWIPLNKDGAGIWSVIEFFEDEINLIDKCKCEICVF